MDEHIFFRPWFFCDNIITFAYTINLNIQIFYHGSSVLFQKFDLSHVLEGDGKVKFGYGVYLTSSFKSAAHYSETKSRPATNHYVYTVLIPDFTDDNHIDERIE